METRSMALGMSLASKAFTGEDHHHGPAQQSTATGPIPLTCRTIARWPWRTCPIRRTGKEVDEAVGATAFGFNVYGAEPGELVPWGSHRHPDPEELFYVVERKLAVETPDGEFTVGTGEAFFVPENTPNTARAVGDRPTRFVVVGAPKDADTSIIEEPCPSGGETTGRDSRRAGEMVVLTGVACGTETARFGPGPDD